jgi:hypothetical protein
MDKSLLHWPLPESRPSPDNRPSPENRSSPDNRAVTIEAAADKPHEERVPAPPQVQPIQPELLQMLPILPMRPSFEDRWRLR